MNPKYLLDAYNIAPKKSLGQNFLHDPNTLEKIIDAAEISPEDTLLEIGPGTGALTVGLAQSAGQVVAVEIDERMLPILGRQLGDFHNVQVHHGDFLKLDLADLVGDKPYTVVANLPYYITNLILRKLLESSHKPRRLVITIQAEVAERIVAKPGDMSILAVSVQFYGTPKIVTRLNPAVFYPRPEVFSAVLRVDIHPHNLYDVPDDKTFFKVVRAGFSQKRKQLKNALSAGLALSHSQTESILMAAQIDPMRRAETLALPDWVTLTRVAVAQIPHLDQISVSEAG
jgi:16S rRNA (adenine1518-N6/adenine1519-N6)-dimethyltransferase